MVKELVTPAKVVFALLYQKLYGASKSNFTLLDLASHSNQSITSTEFATHNPAQISQPKNSTARTPSSAKTTSQTPHSEPQTPHSNIQTPQSAMHAKSPPSNKVSDHIPPRRIFESNPEDITNVDSDFDEFAEFAEYPTQLLYHIYSLKITKIPRLGGCH
jgi:hypothetical protein